MRSAKMTIGALSEAVGTERQTIRYYEKMGLLLTPPRTESGYRIYDDDAVTRLRFVKRAKGIGFTLAEIKTLLALADGTLCHCSEVQDFVQAKRLKVEEQIKYLMSIKQTLDELDTQCRSSDTFDPCPLLEILMNDDHTISHERLEEETS